MAQSFSIRAVNIVSDLQEVAQDPLPFARSGSTRDGTARRGSATSRGAAPITRPSSFAPRRHLELRRQPVARRPRASGSGRPGTAWRCRRTRRVPSCSIVDVLPCIGAARARPSAERRGRSPGARDTRPASASVGRTCGSLPSRCRPSSGRPGPGEITIALGRQRARSRPASISSLRRTTTVAPSSPSYWTRL